MTEIIKSKGWDWNLVSDEYAEDWKNPSKESFYLINRWKGQGKKDFLDSGCGIGRHVILFTKNGFNTFAFDISADAIKSTRTWAQREKLDNIDFAVGDMLSLPYENESIDCILCRNALSHTDTKGMYKAINELKRVLRPGGECYLTLGSKNKWIEDNWPQHDENTYLCQEEHEFNVPHFYANYALIQELFKDFKIEDVEHTGNFHKINGNDVEIRHFHVLIKKEDLSR